MNFSVIIPARLHSTRLPGKVLLDIHGKPMIQHVYERALESGADKVMIATDHEDVLAACEKFNAPVCMTDGSHQSGTERLSEAVATLALDEDDIVVCLQADEPQLPPQLIAQVAKDLAEHDQVKVATLATKINDIKDLLNPNVVKVVLNYRNQALFFSRAPIPWDREQFQDIKSLERGATLKDMYFRHIGIYAYRAGFLETYINLAPCAIETCESLEQLRVLWNGHKIHVSLTDIAIAAGVDTEEDLERVRR